ncbi:hypothetical protein GBAR_LOCUS13158 [Geodia barretti]|uniref:Uncharacterized protein n=1 Tax=Geodia barretti TaxID=519541 RepID=A0AA35S2S6_GEOBA|nr:hypothetical protein GBAR_LOCUS13158 [Geodia barretti]
MSTHATAHRPFLAYRPSRVQDTGLVMEKLVTSLHDILDPEPKPTSQTPPITTEICRLKTFS